MIAEEPADVTFSVTITSGERAETIHLVSPLPLIGSNGLLTPISMATGDPGVAPCAGGSLPDHFRPDVALLSSYTYSLDLPPNVSQTFTAHRRLRPDPWVADLAPYLTATFELSPGARVTSVAPDYTGPLAVPVLLTSKPKATRHVGQALTLRGEVRAPLAGDTISLRAGRRTIGRTTIAPDGRFTFRWTPHTSGRYTVRAVYDRPRPGYLTSRSECPVAVTVRR